MPTVRIDARDGHSSAIVEVSERARLLDVCDEARARVPFSCRSANCGTCAVEVLEGAELLEAAEHAERTVLSEIGARAGDRLACQIVVRAGAGCVRVRALRSLDGSG